MSQAKEKYKFEKADIETSFIISSSSPCRRSARLNANVDKRRQCLDGEKARLPVPRSEENVKQFYERCLSDLKRMPLEVVIPYHLTEDYDKLTE